MAGMVDYIAHNVQQAPDAAATSLASAGAAKVPATTGSRNQVQHGSRCEKSVPSTPPAALTTECHRSLCECTQRHYSHP